MSVHMSICMSMHMSIHKANAPVDITVIITVVTSVVPSPTGTVLEHAELIAKVRRGQDRLVPESLPNEANKHITELKSHAA